MAVLGLAFLAACTPETKCARLPEGAHYCLQAAEEMAPYALQQKIDISFDGRSETMIGQLEVDAAGMRFVGLTPLGQRLLRASFAGGKVEADGMALKTLDPALLLALIQLSSWEAWRVRQGLDDSTELDEDAAGRRLTKEGQTVLRTQYLRDFPPRGKLLVELPGAGVEFRISTLEASFD
jgi:hypothetical protein